MELTKLLKKHQSKTSAFSDLEKSFVYLLHKPRIVLS